MEELSVNLLNIGAGCKLGNVYINHIFYADDIILMAPSPAALQKLISTCEEFGKAYDIQYNVTKTVCMSFLTKTLKDFIVPSMMLYNCALKQVNDFKYLGVFISSDKSDIHDLQRQLRYIYAKGNMLVRKFSKCSIEIKCQLFRSYCCNMYCTHLWSHYPESKLRSVKVAYNNIFRSFFNVSRNTSVSRELLNHKIDSFPVLLRKSIVNFRRRLLSSCNSILMYLMSHFHLSTLSQKWKKEIF
jgi:hypothetical protein